MSACPIIGMPNQCNDGKSGVKIGYWIGLEDIDDYAVDASGNVTSISLVASASFKVLNFEKEDAFYKWTKSGEKTSHFYIQTVEFMYKKLSNRARQFVTAAGAANGVVFVLKDWNGNIITSGLGNGHFLDAGEGGTGQKMGELNGDKLTFVANEPYREYYMSAAVFATLTLEN